MTNLIASRDGLISPETVLTLAEMAAAAYLDVQAPAGYDLTAVANLGLEAVRLGVGDDGEPIYHKNNATAIVATDDQPDHLIVAITGTDQSSDALDWLNISDTYYKDLIPLRDVLITWLAAHPFGTVDITGHSLGAAAAELMLRDLKPFAERVHAVTFASPLATLENIPMLLNIGFDNDLVYKATPLQIDNSLDATEHLLLALQTDSSLAVHAAANYVAAVDVIAQSRFLAATAHDTYTVIAQGTALVEPPGWFGDIDSKGLLVLALPGSGYLEGGGGKDSLEGNTGNDTILARANDDVAAGGLGDDVIYGHTGQDTLFGDDGADTVFGGQDADYAYGNTGLDIIYGNLGIDSLFGGGGQDVIYGGQGQDWLSGGSGDDTIIGNRDDDTLSGGAGADIFVFRQNFGADILLDFDQSQGDAIDLGGTEFSLSASEHGFMLINTAQGQIELIGILPDAVIFA